MSQHDEVCEHGVGWSSHCNKCFKKGRATMDERDLQFVQYLEAAKKELEGMKAEPVRYDARAISIAITNLETAMLWFANARKS